MVQKKLRLLILFENLWEIKDRDFVDQDRVSLFEKLFNQAYTIEKDNLLRNEFRLLNQIIEDHLVAIEIQKEVVNNKNAYNYYLLRVLQERKSLDLFKKEYQEAYDLALENADYYAAHNITGLNFVNYTQFINLKEKDIEYINKLNDLKLSHLSCYYLTAFRTHQINNEYAKTFFYPFSIHETSPLKEVKVDFEAYENDYSSYLFLKAKSFVVPHQERIEILEQCLKFVQLQSSNSKLFQAELKFCLARLANVHSLLFDFEKAAFYFEEFFKLPFEINDPQRLSVLCDYLTKLIKLKDYDKVIQLIEENKNEINKIEKLKTRLLCIEIAAYAFAKKTDDLRATLPKTISEFSQPLKTFFRFYYAIYNYLTWDILESNREIQNLKSAITNKDTTFDVSAIHKFFARFFYILVTFLPSDEKRKHYLNSLSEDIELYNKETLPEYRSYLPFIWLKETLKEMLNKLN